MKTIETLLLNCIDSEIQDNEFSGLIKVKIIGILIMGKFEWLYNKYVIESRSKLFY